MGTQGFDGIVHLMPSPACRNWWPKPFWLGFQPTSTSRAHPDFDEHTSPGAVQTRLEAFVDLIKRRR